MSIPVPAVSPSNAFELFEQMCEVILEEPLRYCQNVWCIRGREAIDRTFAGSHCLQAHEQPACHTVACVAGWMVTLTNFPLRHNNYLLAASELLGVKYTMLAFPSMQSTFAEDVLELFGYQPHSRIWTPAGSRAYAEWGVSRIREFMAKHEDRLRRVVYSYEGGTIHVRLV